MSTKLCHENNADADAVYAKVFLPYRDPASCDNRPSCRSDPGLGRMVFPDRPGVGTAFEEIITKMEPVEMRDGRKLQAKGEVF